MGNKSVETLGSEIQSSSVLEIFPPFPLQGNLQPHSDLLAFLFHFLQD